MSSTDPSEFAKNMTTKPTKSGHYLSTLLSPFLNSLMVGKPWTLMFSNSLAVESILAMTTSSESANFSPSLSQMGTSCLQWPERVIGKGLDWCLQWPER